MRRASVIWFVGIVLIVLLNGLKAGEPAGETVFSADTTNPADALIRLREIVLEDQFEVTCAYTFPLARPMVLLVADRKGYEALAPWIEAACDEAGPDATIVGIADVRGVPGFLRGKVRRKFQSGLTHSVLLDWNGEVLNLLNPQEGIPNAYVINIDGSVRCCVSGRATPGNRKKVQHGLEQALSALDR